MHELLIIGGGLAGMTAAGMEKFEEQVKQFPIDVKIGQGVSNLSQISQALRVM